MKNVRSTIPNIVAAAHKRGSHDGINFPCSRHRRYLQRPYAA